MKEVVPMKSPRKQPAQLANRSMPPGVVIPELAYADVAEAAAWLCNAFGFVERLRIANHRSQLSFGEGSVIVTGQAVDPSELPAEGLNHSVLVRVPDVEAHHEHARLAGALIVSPPADFAYGERQYTADDLGGHRWTFSQTIADIDPDTWGGALIE
jgi:uncharacterized glyoxalase superfamily protein PhnB